MQTTRYRFNAIQQGLHHRRRVSFPGSNLSLHKDKWIFAVFIGLVFYKLPSNEKHPNLKRQHFDRIDENIDTELMLTFFDHQVLEWLASYPPAYDTAFKLATNPTTDTPLGQLILASYGELNTEVSVEPCTSVPVKTTQAPTDNAKQVSNIKSQISRRQQGQQFYNWLLTQLTQREMRTHTLNTLLIDAPLGTAIVSPDIFKHYIKHDDTYNNWQRVQDGFLKLKVHLTNDKHSSHFHPLRINKKRKYVIYLK